MVVPKLRFQEFDGDWPSIPLKNFVSFRKGKGISKADIQEDGVFECIRYGELYTTYGQVITTIKSRTNISPSESILSQSGDVIIPASGETQIDIATASCVAKENVILGGDLNILSHNESGEWLAYYLSSAKKLEIAQLAQGNSVVHLYSSQLKELKVNRPSKEEQTKIATFLSAVDEKIAQLSQKLHLLGQYKQGMMQKLFSQQIRFKADDGSEFGELKIGKLGDMTSIQGGFAFKSTNFGKGITKVIRIGDIEKNINLNLFSGICSNEIPDTRYLISENAIVMALSGATFGKLGKVKQGSAYINQRVATFHVFEDSLNEFVYQIMLSQEFTTYIQSIPSASAQPNISNQDVINFDMLIPCLEEQTKIANFLSAIDQKMDVVSEQLKQAKIWKKGLLQQMFV